MSQENSNHPSSMININLTIVNCTLLDSNFRKTPVAYEIKTFWCSPVKLFGDAYGKTDSIRLHGLSVGDYLTKEKDGDNLTICIEVSSPVSSVNRHKGLITSNGNCLVGVVLVHLNELIKKPYLCPLWENLPVVNVIKGTTEGSIYLTLEVDLENPDHPYASAQHENGKNENESSYITITKISNAQPNSALVCPPHLVDNVAGILSRDAELLHNQCEVQMTPESNKLNDVPVNAQEVQVQKNTFSEVPAESSKGHRMDAHNLCTSPDFPFHVPAVESVEKLIRFAQNPNMQEGTVSDLPCIGSPPMFSYTPTPYKTCGRSQSDFRGSMEDIIESLNKVSAVRGSGNPRPGIPETPKSASTPTSIGHKKPCDKSKATTSKKIFGVGPKPMPSRAAKIISSEINSVRVPLSPKQSSSKPPQPKNTVPGLTIKSYKPTTSAEEAQAVSTPPPKRRIAANIFRNEN